ncbi:MAG: hypothetical protein HY667_00715 [Chloroflexi bacterium]|nr:hypothetical protein [Chloroflexota bacterium]
MSPEKMQAMTEFIKSLVRPFIVVWDLVIYGVCIMRGIAVPDLLGLLIAAIVIEYFGERAFMRFKENGRGGV